MHRHFADFDAFLAEFVLDPAGRMAPEAAALPGAAGRPHRGRPCAAIFTASPVPTRTSAPLAM